MTQSERLAIFSEKVRESSLKRFRLVGAPDRAWSPAAGRLSFVDHLKHLVDCDRWILAVVKGEEEPHADIQPGEGEPSRWDSYVSEFEALGIVKASFFRGLSDADLDSVVIKPEHLGRPDAGLLILRENLEHEVQHRGSVQLLLRLRYG